MCSIKLNSNVQTGLRSGVSTKHIWFGLSFYSPVNYNPVMEFLFVCLNGLDFMDDPPASPFRMLEIQIYETILG